jgi:hypothetical protein
MPARLSFEAPPAIDVRLAREFEADRERQKHNQPCANAGLVAIYQAAVGGLRRLLPADYSRERERGCLDGFAIQIALDTRLRIFP